LDTLQQEIINAALELFTSKGYKETRIADIAKRANTSVATIYKYYPGKKSLFESLNKPELMLLRPQFGEKRNAIMKEALILFGHYGFYGTTMEKIAEKVGLSKATLYQYFESKEDLFSAVMDETSFKSEFEEFENRTKGNNLEEDIFNIGIAYLHMFDNPERIAFTRSLIRDSDVGGEIGKIFNTHGIGYVSECVAQCLDKYKNAQLKDDLDITVAARTYVGSLFAFAIQYKVIKGVPRICSDEELVSTSAKIFLNGILK